MSLIRFVSTQRTRTNILFIDRIKRFKGEYPCNLNLNMLSFVEVLAALHLTINLKAAQIKLKGLSGIYCIKCTVTGAMYIGSSINLAVRLTEHLVYGHTNRNLNNALAKYGLENFSFCVLEFCDRKVLLQREQHYITILFSLSANLRYNFASVTEAPFTGLNHTEETRTRMSDVKSGANNPLRFLVWTSLAEEAQHPMYGKVPTHAMTVNVYSLDNQLVRSFFLKLLVLNG